MTLRRALLLVPPLLLAAWFAWRWSALPARIASSFDFSGRAQDETSRGAFVALASGTSTLMPAFLAIVSASIGRVPASLVNLPDKEHWLAPERRAATLERVSAFLEWLGVAQGSVFAALFVAIGEHAVAGEDRFPSAWLVLPLLLVVGVLAGLVWLLAPILSRRRSQRTVR